MKTALGPLVPTAGEGLRNSARAGARARESEEQGFYYHLDRHKLKSLREEQALLARVNATIPVASLAAQCGEGKAAWLDGLLSNEVRIFRKKQCP